MLAEDLIAAARVAMDRSVVVHPETYPVGCAILGSSGKVYEGIYVAGGYGYLSRHAEDTAITHALIHGEHRIEQVAIIARFPGDLDRYCLPCGTCRELLLAAARRGSHDFEVLCANGRGQYRSISAESLLSLATESTVDNE